MMFDKDGSGPPVVLIHGLGASTFSWKQTISALPHFTTYAVDLLGFGRSRAPNGFAFTVPAQANAVKEFVRDQRLPEPIILIGHSMGGAISLELAAQASRGASPRLKKMVLIDPVAPPPPPSSAVIGPADLKDPPKVLARKILERIYKPGSVVRPEFIDGYAKGLSLPGQIEALLRHATNLTEVLFPKATLGAIKTETLIIWGEDDPILPPQGRAKELGAALFKATLEIVKSCGHVPQEEAPAKTNKLIADFLSK